MYTHTSNTPIAKGEKVVKWPTVRSMLVALIWGALRYNSPCAGLVFIVNRIQLVSPHKRKPWSENWLDQTSLGDFLDGDFHRRAAPTVGSTIPWQAGLGCMKGSWVNQRDHLLWPLLCLSILLPPATLSPSLSSDPGKGLVSKPLCLSQGVHPLFHH